jgi:hypothetical protein
MFVWCTDNLINAYILKAYINAYIVKTNRSKSSHSQSNLCCTDKLKANINAYIVKTSRIKSGDCQPNHEPNFVETHDIETYVEANLVKANIS